MRRYFSPHICNPDCARGSRSAAEAIAAAWSTNFTSAALGNDVGPWSSMFTDSAQLMIGDKTMTITKGEADPSKGVVTIVMMQTK